MGGPIETFKAKIATYSFPVSEGKKAAPAKTYSPEEIKNSKRNTLDDLRMVGKNKPLGYLTEGGIIDSGETVASMTVELKAKGLKVIYFPKGATPETAYEGVMVAYDEQALQEHLNRNSALLRENNWSVTADQFARQVMGQNAPIKTKLFDVVADAFADYHNKLRTDVMLSITDWEFILRNEYRKPGNQAEQERLEQVRKNEARQCAEAETNEKLRALQSESAAAGFPGLFDSYSLPDQSFSTAHLPENFAEETAFNLSHGRRSRFLVINFSGGKYINDNMPGGHTAGNAYLKANEAKILSLAERAGIVDAFIVRNGQNFAVSVSGEINAEAFMASIEAAFADGTTFEYEYNGQKYTQTYSPQTEGRGKIAKAGILTFAPEVNGMSVEAIERALSQEIYYLNRPEANRRTGQEFIVDAKYAAYLETLTLKNRLVDRHPKVEAKGANVEVRSGLHNAVQMRADAVDILRKGHKVRVVFFDGNAFGSWRSMGFIGELFMDAIVEQRIPEAAMVLPKGISIYRHGPGSEEFYLLADSAEISEAQMQKAMSDFMQALNEKPLRLKVEKATLEATEPGRAYLAQWKSENPGKALPEMFEVDATGVIRGRMGVYHRGITVTAGMGEISSQGKVTAERSFEAGFQEILDHGEAAKKLNPKRKNFMVKVEKGKTRVIELAPEISDPKPILNENAQKIAFDTGQRFLEAKKQALNRIDELQQKGRITKADAEQMKQEASKGWDEALQEVESAAAKKAEIDALKTERKQLKSDPVANKARLIEIDKALETKTKRFVRAHGQMLALIVSMDLIRNWSEVIKGDLPGFAASAGSSVVDYFVFVETEKGLGALTGLSKRAALPAAGGFISAAHAVYKHRGHFASADMNAPILSGIDVVKEGVAGYLSTKVMIAVTAATAETGPLCLLFGLGAASATYLATGKLAKTLGYDKLLERSFTAAEIKDAFYALSFARTKLKVENGNTDTAFFNDNSMGLSRGQQTLIMLTAMEAYFKMSAAEKVAFALDKKNQAVVDAFFAFSAVSELQADKYASLTPEAFDVISQALVKFYQEDQSVGQYRKVRVRLTSEQVKIRHPLTNELAGIRMVYYVTVAGQKHRAILGWTKAEWEPIEGTARKKTYKKGGQALPLGDPIKLSQAQALMAKETDGSFSLSLHDAVALGISIPFDNLRSFPNVIEDLANSLSRLGYKVENEFGEATPGSLYRAYYLFCRDEGLPFKGEGKYDPDAVLMPAKNSPVLEWNNVAWVLIELDPAAKENIEALKEQRREQKTIQEIISPILNP